MAVHLSHDQYVDFKNKMVMSLTSHGGFGIRYGLLAAEVDHCSLLITSNKNIHFEMILDVGIGEKRKETRFLI